MTTSKGIVLLLLEPDAAPLLAAGFFGCFPHPPAKSRALGWNCKFALPLLPCQFDRGGYCSSGLSSRPESAEHLPNDIIAGGVEMKLGGLRRCRRLRAERLL